MTPSALCVGTVSEVLTSDDSIKSHVHNFVREQHAAGRGLESYLAIGVMPSGLVWLLAADNDSALRQTLRYHNAVEAEVMQLKTIH